jgi:hypothetical protein
MRQETIRANKSGEARRQADEIGTVRELKNHDTGSIDAGQRYGLHKKGHQVFVQSEQEDGQLSDDEYRLCGADYPDAATCGSKCTYGESQGAQEERISVSRPALSCLPICTLRPTAGWPGAHFRSGVKAVAYETIEGRTEAFLHAR